MSNRAHIGREQVLVCFGVCRRFVRVGLAESRDTGETQICLRGPGGQWEETKWGKRVLITRPAPWQTPY